MFYNIRIDNALLSYLASRRIKVEELFVIACLNLNKKGLLKDYLKGMTGDQMTAYFQSLERKQLLKKLTPELVDFDWDNYELTDAADDVFDECAPNIYDSEEEPKEGTVVLTVPQERDKMIQTEEFIEFMKQFLALWPDGVRNINGDYLRSNQRDLIKKLRQFLTKYKYNYDVILKATTTYLKRQGANGYSYCSQAHYFVSKNGESKLATECEAIVKGKQSAEDSGGWINTM
jgi:hypothetical protein